MLKRGLKQCFFEEMILDIGFHTFSYINSTYPSTIWDKSSASYARALAKNSVSDQKWMKLNILVHFFAARNMKIFSEFSGAMLNLFGPILVPKLAF
jgi:hypothetical protein